MIDQPSRDFNFDRLKSVVAQQGWNRLPGRVIMVAGTNGKGSCIAALHALCRHVHLNVATFTSPHCWTVHERFKYNEHNISSEALYASIQRAESLSVHGSGWSFFETLTLAFFDWVTQLSPDVILLEVGLGGRLDAVNTTDHEGAIITSIAYDHEAILGHTLEAIAFEKSGIMRAGMPCIWGMGESVPETILNQAIIHQAVCISAPIDPGLRGYLPRSSLHAAQLAWKVCFKDYPLESDLINAVIMEVQLSGRFQVSYAMGRQWIIDVAHNPAACQHLVNQIQSNDIQSVDLICAFAQDKAIESCLQALRPIVRYWYCADLKDARILDAQALKMKLLDLGVESSQVQCFEHFNSVDWAAQSKGHDQCPVLVCGSFLLLDMVQHIMKV